MPFSSDDFFPSDYPFDFPRDSRDRVELEILRAEKELESITASELYKSEWDEAALMEVLCRVVVAFGREAFSLVEARNWTLEHHTREVHEFLRRKTDQMDSRRPRHSRSREKWIGSLGQLTPWLLQEVKKFQQWKQYEQELLEVAERLCSPPATASQPAPEAAVIAEDEKDAVPPKEAARKPEPQSKLPDNIKRLRKKLRVSQDVFADTLGISLRQLQEHELGRVKPQDRHLLLYAQFATKHYAREITVDELLNTDIEENRV